MRARFGLVVGECGIAIDRGLLQCLLLSFSHPGMECGCFLYRPVRSLSLTNDLSRSSPAAVSLEELFNYVAPWYPTASNLSESLNFTTELSSAVTLLSFF